MSEDVLPDRRAAIVAALGVAGGAMIPGAMAAGNMQGKTESADPAFESHARDWHWLVGSWAVGPAKFRSNVDNYV